MAIRTFKFYPNCKFVEGTAFSAIYDFGKSRIVRFPASLFKKIRSMEGHVIQSEGGDEFPSEAELDTSEMLKKLLSLDVGFITSSASHFLPLVDAVKNGSIGDEAASSRHMHGIIEFGEYEHDIRQLMDSIGELNIRDLQLNFLSAPSEYDVARYFSDICSCGFMISLEIIAPWQGIESEDMWLRLMHNHREISAVCLHSSTSDRVLYPDSDEGSGLARRLHLRTEQVDLKNGCGNIALKMISQPSLELFRRTSSCNGCLHGKVTISEKGQLKNCPSLAKEFGHYSDVSVINVVRSEDFRASWGITKDRVEICNECEFRYACTDCRAHVLDVSSDSELFGKPARCRYDPRSGVWATDSSVTASS